jgi:hypothetical protein
MNLFTAKEYIDISIANAMQMDKLTWQERLDWVEENEENLLVGVLNTKEPYQLMAAVDAKRCADEGEPTGYIMGLDACSSGIQIMCLMAGDLVGARLCGLINTGDRQDVYKTYLDDMTNELGDLPFTRTDIKGVGMKVLYGSRAEPRKVLKDPLIISSFYEAIERNTPICTNLLFAFLACADDTAKSYKWTLPDGHEAETPVTKVITYTFKVPELDNHPVTHKITENLPKDRDVSIPANAIQSIDGYIVRELGLRCNHNPNQLKRIISLIDNTLTSNQLWLGVPSITRALDLTQDNINSYDSRELYALRELCLKLLCYVPFEQISVHDKYFASPIHMNMVRLYVIDIYAELADSDYLEAMLAQISNGKSTFKKTHTNLGDLIRESEYIVS